MLRPQSITTKVIPDNNNRETIKEQNNYQMWIQ